LSIDHALVALSTVSSEADAERIARALVEERLAACVNMISAVRSIYRWKGAVEDEQEILLLMKTTTDTVERLRVRLHELHPYELPEFVVLQVDRLSAAYGAWILDSVEE
jgi:periplasmic divalent cation tolerance protein